MMGLAIPKIGSSTLVKKGKWDHYLESSTKTDRGFNLPDSPFGQEEFDVIPHDSILQFKYEDRFTGLIFFKPVQEHQLRTGWDGFAASDLLSELRRGIKFFSEAMDLKSSDNEGHKVPIKPA